MRAEKQLLVDEIKEKLERSQGFVLARYKHLAPNTSADFRMKLAEAGGDVEVVKKRLLRKAAESAGIALGEMALEGHIALLFSESEPVALTKAIYAFCKEHAKLLDVLCGRFEGAMYSGQDVAELAKLPEKDVMRAQLLSTLEAPMAALLGVVEALLCSVALCIENYLTKQQEV